MEKMISEALFERAQKVIPGGVNSPVRAFRGVGGVPPFIASGAGCQVTDVDGKTYIDYVGSYGPLILGHAHPAVTEALIAAARGGTTYGAPTKAEILLAETIVERVPGVDMVRLVNSGTEATMSALRLARAATGRSKFVKITGCYHGHADPFLVQAGSGALTLGVPNSPGVPAPVVADTLLAPFNDAAAVEALLEANRDAVAAVFVEPIAGNIGCVPPVDGYLARLREITRDHGVVLVFDEVMTGFRVARGGAAERYGVTPDLVTLGKIIGGGLPVGAYAGSRALMEQVSPLGGMYQAGTLSGNPLAVAAGRATLELLDAAAYERLEILGQRLEAGTQAMIQSLGLPLTFQRVGSMFCLYFTPQAVTSYADALTSDTQRFARFFHAVLDAGVYLAPAQYESGFISLAHTEAEIDRTLEIVQAGCREAFRD